MHGDYNRNVGEFDDERADDERQTRTSDAGANSCDRDATGEEQERVGAVRVRKYGPLVVVRKEEGGPGKIERDEDERAQGGALDGVARDLRARLERERQRRKPNRERRNEIR